MKNYIDILKKCALFEGICPDDFTAMLACLNAKTIQKKKNEYIFYEGDRANNVGILLSGSAQVVRDDYYGRRSVVASIMPAQIFGETFACAGIEHLPVSVIAAETCCVLLIDCRRITFTCSNACEFHNRMVLNLLKVVAAHNLILSGKLEITSQRTTREKLMAYLLHQAKISGSNAFTIPFDRQSLADYLNVDRSALSTEIGKLRSEGIIESNRSRFILLNREER